MSLSIWYGGMCVCLCMYYMMYFLLFGFSCCFMLRNLFYMRICLSIYPMNLLCYFYCISLFVNIYPFVIVLYLCFCFYAGLSYILVYILPFVFVFVFVCDMDSFHGNMFYLFIAVLVVYY